MRTDLDQCAPDRDASAQHLAGDCTGGDTAGGFTRRGPAAAAIVADAVLRLICEVRVAGPEFPRNIAVVLGALILVLDHQGDRGAGGQTLEHPGLDLHEIRLLSLGGEARLA